MSSPSFVEPQLATLVDEPVEGEHWIFERKLDGIRLIVVRDGESVRLWTRNQLDRASTYPELCDALLSLPTDRFVADAEVVAFEGSTTSFARLQQRSGLTDPDEARGSGVAVRLYLFDLLHLDGRDLRELPLRERKSILHDAIDFDDPIRFCRHRNGGGSELLDDACRRGWEGLIAKRADRPYRSGRSRDWLKLKCVARQEFVIGGFTEPKGSRNGIGAILIGVHDPSAGTLRYAGRVGTGFDSDERDRLRSVLERRTRSTAPFDEPPTGGGDVHWVTPDLVCEVGFTEWTSHGKLRHPRYVGMRHDKDANEVVRERAVAAS
jgi:bifunctional non-homologous end joining protein LigD